MRCRRLSTIGRASVGCHGPVMPTASPGPERCQSPTRRNLLKRYLVIVLTALTLALGFPSAAFAQSGHFVAGGANAPVCVDIGLQVRCTGKVAGLGGTTFEITISAPGLATVECHNPAGNVAPGQDTEVNVAGSTGPLPTPRNGQFIFTVTTDSPAPLPPTPTCPNVKWTPVITDVAFTTATVTLLEDGVQSDQIVVNVS